MILKTYIVCAHAAEEFQRAFDEAIQKIAALGSKAAQPTYALRDGKYVAFIAYHIVETQKDWDMSLPVEALADLEKTRRTTERQRLDAAYRASIEEIRASEERRASRKHEKPKEPQKKNTGRGKTIRVAPAWAGVGRRAPTGMGQRWERLVAFFKEFGCEPSS